MANSCGIICKTLLFIFLLSFNPSFSQTKSVKDPVSKLTVRGGFNFQNLKGKEQFTGAVMHNDFIPRFHIGIGTELAVAKDLYLKPELILNGKGSTLESPDGQAIRFKYLDLNLSLVSKHDLSKGKFLIGVGPYVGIGISGNIKFLNTEAAVYWGEDDPNYPDIAEFRRLDAGANLFLGYTVNRILVQANGQLGMADIKGGQNPGKYSNIGFGISFGYRVL